MRHAVRIGILVSLLPVPAAAVDSHLIYLNACKPNGCAVHFGPDDATTHTSSVVGQDSTVGEFAFSDATFARAAGCLRGVFARYDVSITTTDPGAAPRRELMLAGRAQDVGQPMGVQGVAPFTGVPIDNAIAFAFATDIGDDPDALCWIAASQIGHLYGLDDAHYCPDVMSYLAGCGVKSFTDVDAPCGEFADRTCASGAPTQNGDATLRLVIGDADRIFLAGFDPPMPAP